MKPARRAYVASSTVVAAFLCLALGVALAGCGNSGSREAPSQAQGVSEVMQEQMDAEDGTKEEQPVASRRVAQSSTSYAKDQVDIDLASMGADMVYATVYDMMTKPDVYVGKVVRMSGSYYHTLYEGNGLDYFYVIIKDATACCSQGLEFVWDDGSHVYPDDYPADGMEVTVTGIFEAYTEDNQEYVRLRNAQLQVGKAS